MAIPHSIAGPVVGSRRRCPYERLGRYLGPRPRIHGAPHNAGKWGATVCMGFTLFRATAATREFVSRANRLFPDERDDQRWVNFALSRVGIQWPEVAQGKRMVEFGPKVSTTIGRVDSIGLDVALLDPVLVLRACSHSVPRMPVVEHCYVVRQKGNENKIRELKRRHTWFVNETMLKEVASGSESLLTAVIPDNSTSELAWRLLLEKFRVV